MFLSNSLYEWCACGYTSSGKPRSGSLEAAILTEGVRMAFPLLAGCEKRI
jgi:hypothetical protein